MFCGLGGRVAGWMLAVFVGVAAWVPFPDAFAADDAALELFDTSGPAKTPMDSSRTLTIDYKEIAVKADSEAITIDQVFEVWGPAWYEAMNAARAGKIPAEEVDKRLQEEWTKALDTVTRDALFYQEAQREFEKKFQEMIDQRYSRQQAGPNDGSRPHSREQLTAKYRRDRDMALQAQLDEIIDQRVRASGGVNSLKRMLEARGLTWEEWRQRQIRKVYTSTYLQMKIRPVEGVEYRPSDVLQFYRDNPDIFTTPGEVTFRHVLFAHEKRGGAEKAYAAAWEAYDKLQQGQMTFEEAARTLSDDPVSAARDGLESAGSAHDERESWLSFVRDAAKEEQPGKLGSLLESAMGYHLVMLIKKDPGELIPFRIAQKTIQEQMRAQDWEKKLVVVYAELRKQVLVEVLVPTFPPTLSWTQMQRQQKTVRRIGPASGDVR